MSCRGAGFGVLFFGLSGAGCGEVTSSPSSEPQAPPRETITGSAYAGGTRLRAVLAEASDGTASFFHWWDTDLGVQCRFEPVDEPEASFRCRPESGPVIYEGMDEVFGDAECSEPLVSLPAGGPRVVRRLAAQCYNAEYFRAGARFSGAVIYRKTDSGCLPEDPVANVSSELFTLEALPTSAFVAARDADVPATAGVVAGQRVADDGSRAPHGFRDGAGGFRCWPRRTVSGIRCLPDDFGWGDRGGYYSDAGCRVPAAVTGMGCGDGRASVPYVFSENPGIEGVVTVRRGGPRLPEVFQQAGVGECAAGFRDTVAFAIGEPLELGGFLPASLSQATRPSGLVQTVAEVDGKAVALFSELSASALGGYACELAATPDGAVRCVPRINYTQEQYADAACTDPIWQADFGISSVAASDPLKVAAGTTDPVTLPAIDRVLIDGTPYDGPVYEQRGAECTRVAGVPNTRQPYKRFGGEAPLSELPVLSIVVR